jgi:hypothetical protein
MVRNRIDDHTWHVERPVWNGTSFADADAEALWSQLSNRLMSVARAELAAGNSLAQILRDNRRGITLIAFDRGPLTETPTEPGLRVHTEHQYGNYCYDGTKCTYEDTQSGCFVAFDDPEFREDAF